MKSIEMEKKEETKGSSISMVEAKLPPGFRFHPRDDELVCDYLMRRTAGSRYHQPIVLIEVDLNKCEPWDIPQWAKVGGKEWYFYSQKDRKYATGQRTNRATGSGYWKATGKDRGILRKGRGVVGMRKTLVFYQGRAPKGRKTDWVMHEFRLQHSPPLIKEEWVLCRVFHKKSERENMIRISCSDDQIQSASLTPLMDSYIKFDQQLPSFPSDHDHGDIIMRNQQVQVQVPCFSFLPQNQTNVNLSTPSLFTASSDQMVLRALLSQLTNRNSTGKEKESESCGEGSSESESHLTHNIGIPIPSTLWNY